MKRIHAVIVLLLMSCVASPQFAARAQGAAIARPPSTLVGTWRGTSICRPVGKPACHDEIAVYHFRRADSSAASAGELSRGAARATRQIERLMWQADKVVNGVEEEMGTMECTYTPVSGDVLCPMRGWRWEFRAATGRDGVTLTGTLRNPVGVVWRDVRVTRAATDGGGQR